MENDSTKSIVFRGKLYYVLPELAEKQCQGCDLIDKGCYNHKELLSICRKGCIFKRVRSNRK